MQRHGSQEAVLSQPDELKKNLIEIQENSSKKIIHEQEKQLRILTPIQDIDYRTHARIRRGRLEVDAKLDLHGLRQDEAQRALTAFLRRAQADGAKIVIVVTGKGQTREAGGVLRRVVPLWLQAPQLRDLIISFGEAARHHGGEGALSVRIRRADRFRGVN
jgi:DNA-nicking Smr family endonuclease